MGTRRLAGEARVGIFQDSDKAPNMNNWSSLGHA